MDEFLLVFAQTFLYALDDLMTDMLHEMTLALLNWYDQNKRAFPWRVDNPNPYHVWLCEVMSQQTTMGAVVPYFERFITAFPTVHDLAKASEEDVMRHWAGLGYYSRARNLHMAARLICSLYLSSPANEVREGDLKLQKIPFPSLRKAGNDGIMWNDVDFESLPGIGRYTAAAINTMAFNRPDVVVDGNVERIVSRLFAVETPLPVVKKELYALAAQIYAHHHDRSGALSQAFMDLGTEICRPKNPKCNLCPIQKWCIAQSDLYPKRLAKPEKPKRTATAYWIENEKGEVLFERRPPKGLLGGTVGLPCTDLKTGLPTENLTLVIPGERSEGRGSKSRKDSLPSAKGLAGNDELGAIKHIFTHFELTLTIERASVTSYDKTRYFWARPENVEGMSSLFRKALSLGERVG